MYRVVYERINLCFSTVVIFVRFDVIGIKFIWNLFRVLRIFIEFFGFKRIFGF